MSTTTTTTNTTNITTNPSNASSSTTTTTTTITPRSSMTFMGQVATSRHKMVQQVIRNVVCDLTFIDKPSSEFKQCYDTLLQYIMDPVTTDIVYVQLLQRAMDNKQRVAVLLKCTDLIKTFIKQYVPNMYVLIQLHQFCHAMLSHDHKLPHCGLNKSFMFIRAQIVDLTGTITVTTERQEWNAYISSVQSGLKLSVNQASVMTTPDHIPHHFNVQQQQQQQQLQQQQQNQTMIVQSSNAVSDMTILRVSDYYYDGSGGSSNSTNGMNTTSTNNMNNNNSSSNNNSSNNNNITNGGEDTQTLKLSLLDSILFGGQFRKSTKFEDKQPEIDLSNCVFIQNASKMKLQIQQVRNAKRKKEREMNYLPPLFHSLIEEKSSSLTTSSDEYTEDDLEDHLDAVLDDNDQLSVLKSTCFLIKVFAAIYKTGSVASVKQVRSFFIEMIESKSPTIRAHAFDMLFNLYAYIMEDVMNLQQQNTHQNNSTNSNSGNSNSGMNQNGNLNEYYYYYYYGGSTLNERTMFVLDDVFEKFCDMSLYIYFACEKEEAVWTASYSCFLALVTNTMIHQQQQQQSQSQQHKMMNHFIRGVPQNIESVPRSRLLQIDIRVLMQYVKLFKNENDHTMLRYVVRMLMNALYQEYRLDFKQSISIGRSTDFTLDLNKLKLIGGISSIIDTYVFVQSYEAKNNLFVIIFDYLIMMLEQKKKMTVVAVDSSTQKNMLFEVLVKSQAPMYMHTLFKFLPCEFIEKFTKTLYIDLLLKQRSLSSTVKSELDKSMVVLFVVELQELICFYLRMEPEFHAITTEILLTGTISRNHNNNNNHSSSNSSNGITINQTYLNIVQQLISSKDIDERKNGENMLFSIMKFIDDNFNVNKPSAIRQFNISYFEKLKSATDSIMSNLCTSESVESREIFLNVLERMILLQRSRFQSHGDSDKLKILLNLMNESLLRFVTLKENRSTILIRIFSIVMDFLCIYSTNGHPFTSIIDMTTNNNNNNNNNNNTTNNNNNNNHTTNIPNKSSSTSTTTTTTTTTTFRRRTSQYEFPNDDICTLFLQGQICVPFHLLKDVSVSILHHLFTELTNNILNGEPNIPQKQMMEDMRVICLIFIIEKCRSRQVFDSIGIGFFKQMLDDTNPAVSFFAAKYLMKQLATKFPDEYLKFMKQLIPRAQRTDSADLLHNPYLQLINS